MSVVDYKFDNGIIFSIDELRNGDEIGLVILVSDKNGKNFKRVVKLVCNDDGSRIDAYVERSHEIIFVEPEPEDNSLDDSIDSNDVVFMFGCHSEEVKDVQRRLKELGYFNANIGGNYLEKTASAIEAFQLENGIHVDGKILDNATYDILMSINAKPAPEPPQKHAKAMDWWTSDIQKIFSVGTPALITDVETGLQWREQRRGGTNHADVQPLTKEDTKKLKKAYGGKWAWTRRAIWVTIDGVTYAASMNGMPHGSGKIKNNNFDGHHCIHFTNSRTHGTNKVCPNHQKMINKASSVELTI